MLAEYNDETIALREIWDENPIYTPDGYFDHLGLAIGPDGMRRYASLTTPAGHRLDGWTGHTDEGIPLALIRHRADGATWDYYGITPEARFELFEPVAWLLAHPKRGCLNRTHDRPMNTTELPWVAEAARSRHGSVHVGAYPGYATIQTRKADGQAIATVRIDTDHIQGVVDLLTRAIPMPAPAFLPDLTIGEPR